MKRLDYLGWNDYFMNLAILVSFRSKDPNSQVGSVLADRNNRIIGTGYNGMPKGNDEDFPWDKGDENPLNNKYIFVVHSEANLLLNLSQKDLEGSVLYTTLFPCNECAKLIVQSGIKKIYYLDDKYHDEVFCIASRKIFDVCGVEYKQFIPTKKVKLE